MAAGFDFEVTNGDIVIRFSCRNYERRIKDTIANLGLSQGLDDPSIKARYYSSQETVRFLFNGHEEIPGNNISNNAYFFENTDYPILVKGVAENTSIQELYISGLPCDFLTTYDNRLYGTLNYGNQVGQTDFTVDYSINGKRRRLSFTTEVLSYKLNYREDMKFVIKDIEAEYSMLSYAFLKQTYLSFKAKSGKSSDLIWWQIFKECYFEIIKATNDIINSPKLRLQTKTIYERADRLTYVNPEIEREYGEFKSNPNYLYRASEMFLSNDTIENRFLKHALQEVQRRFGRVRDHIKKESGYYYSRISSDLDTMSNTLEGLSRHPFFKSVGRFRGFSQDSLVMKRARGYSTIYRNWVLLECGYELADGIHKLEVKDISELYEIWCFIKIKNIVKDILKEKGIITDDDIISKTGHELTDAFVRQLGYGEQSEVKFMQGNIELASVMYNAQIQVDNDMPQEPESAIKGTISFTTEQRPDIVLRLSKSEDDIKYTYLFDAKYRIEPQNSKFRDFPPADTLNQMHRYRDAIYYAETAEPGDEGLKKEVIGGYVLYPGALEKNQFKSSAIYKSIEQVNIGAFPLRPGYGMIKDDGTIDPSSSEIALRDMIKHWLEDDHPKLSLLKSSIPQHGLQYKSTEDYMEDVVLFGYVKTPKVYLPWINKGHYVIRLKDGNNQPNGAVSLNRTTMMVQHVVLYTTVKGINSLIGIYDIKEPDSIPSQTNSKELKMIGYPSQAVNRSYLLYSIDIDKRSVISSFEVIIRDYLKLILSKTPEFKKIHEIINAVTLNR